MTGCSNPRKDSYPAIDKSNSLIEGATAIETLSASPNMVGRVIAPGRAAASNPTRRSSRLQSEFTPTSDKRRFRRKFCARSAALLNSKPKSPPVVTNTSKSCRLNTSKPKRPCLHPNRTHPETFGSRRRGAAPADGVVANIRLTTLGGGLQPGDEVLQIVPSADAADLPPADLRFSGDGLPSRPVGVQSLYDDQQAGAVGLANRVGG
jgi:hypothetical protein